MFSKKGLLFFTALALLVFVEQASAGPNANAVLSVDIDASDNKMNDGNTSGTAVTGTDIVVEVFISGLAGPIVGGVVTFDTDKLTIKSAAPAAGFFALGTTANTVSFGAVPSGTLTNDYFATVTLTPIAGVTASTEFFDDDSDVDFADYLAFISVFGLSSSDANYDTRMDMNSDGIINFADFLIFAGVFGTTHS